MNFADVKVKQKIADNKRNTCIFVENVIAYCQKDYIFASP